MRTVHVNDSLQKYTYQLLEPEGKNLADGFQPELTPAEMLELGVFGGDYFENEHDEFPAKWFKNARISDVHDSLLNYFEIDAGLSRQQWQSRGWIYDDDPRGWFQWYCRYYLGRRIPEEDARQIKRWRMMTRHVGQIKAYCPSGDLLCRRRQRQAVLQWAYDSRKI